MIAPSLAAAGVDADWCERAAAILDGPALEPGLEWVASALQWTAREHFVSLPPFPGHLT